MASLLSNSASRRRILDLLEFAAHSASETQSERWQFAVELEALLALGVQVTHLRALLSSKAIEHAQETTTVTAKLRAFRRIESLAFPPRTCFVLAASQVVPAIHKARNASDGSTAATPKWDRKSRTLYMNGRIVKQFLVPAPTQEMILTVFQEEAWPCTIDDPLPPNNGQSRKQRLHNAINALNRSRRTTTIRFRGNGKGDGISWELCRNSLARRTGYRARRSKKQSS